MNWLRRGWQKVRDVFWPFITHWFRDTVRFRTPDPFPEHGLPRLESFEEVVLPEDEVEPKDQPLRLCIDLGTFSSTVACLVDADVGFAVLSYDSDAKPLKEIGSAALWIDEKPMLDADSFQEMIDHFRTDEITGSFKRLLFEYRWFRHEPRNRSRLVALYRELLLLSFAPAESSTLILLERYLSETSATAEHESNSGEWARLRHWQQHGGLPIPREDLIAGLAAGAQVRLCVPNSFDALSIDLAIACFKEALQEVLTVFAPDEIDDYLNPVISVIREAEAVAWGAGNDEDQEKIVAVLLDIGAGTTDAALVTIVNSIPRVLHRTGVPFGGDDIDQLLVRMAYQDPNAFVRLQSMKPGYRLQSVRAARSEKEAWSRMYAEGVTDEERAFIEAALQAAAAAEAEEDDDDIQVSVEMPPLPDSREDISIGVMSEDSSGFAAPQTIGNPIGDPRFIRFLRLSVAATCEPLIEAARAEGDIDMILLSGSASYTPGVRETVEWLLRENEIEAEVLHAGELLAARPEMRDVEVVRQSKLICAWGGARSMLHDHETFDRNLLPEAYWIVCWTGVRERQFLLFAAGDRLFNDEISTYFSIVTEGTHLLEFYRYFTPPEHIPSEFRESSWVRRYVGRMTVNAAASGLFVKLRQEPNGRTLMPSLKGWIADVRDRGHFVLKAIELPAAPRPVHDVSPVTGLPIQWLWYDATQPHAENAQ